MASNDGITEAITKYFEGRNRDLMKTLTNNFPVAREGEELNKNAKSFSQDTDWYSRGSN
jgi:hypothetical protein